MKRNEEELASIVLQTNIINSFGQSFVMITLMVVSPELFVT